jgi:hypothetical protein
MSSIERECSVGKIEVKTRVGEAGRELAGPESNRGVQCAVRRKRGAKRCWEPPGGRRAQGKNRQAENCRVVGRKRGHKERAIESKVTESSSSGKRAQGTVGSRQAEEGCKERFVEWRGAKSLLRGRGAEEGRDVVSCMGGAKGRKTGAKQKKGRRGAKLTQEGRRKRSGEEEGSDGARNCG